MVQIRLEEALSDADSARVYSGLLAADPMPRRYQSLAFTLRTPDEDPPIWNWLSIDLLWIEPTLRCRGFGSDMVREAERTAQERGCTHARLDTFDFQARQSYERLGDRVHAQLDDLPAGHTQFHLGKVLDSASARTSRA